METLKLVGYKKPILIAQIIYVKGQGSNASVYLTNGKELLVCMGLLALQQKAPQLIRLHKSYLANKNFIGAYESISSRKGLVSLLNGIKLPVSNTYQSLFNRPTHTIRLA